MEIGIATLDKYLTIFIKVNVAFSSDPEILLLDIDLRAMSILDLLEDIYMNVHRSVGTDSQKLEWIH